MCGAITSRPIPQTYRSISHRNCPQSKSQPHPRHFKLVFLQHQPHSTCSYQNSDHISSDSTPSPQLGLQMAYPQSQCKRKAVRLSHNGPSNISRIIKLMNFLHQTIHQLHSRKLRIMYRPFRDPSRAFLLLPRQHSRCLQANSRSHRRLRILSVVECTAS